MTNLRSANSQRLSIRGGSFVVFLAGTAVISSIAHWFPWLAANSPEGIPELGVGVILSAICTWLFPRWASWLCATKSGEGSIAAQILEQVNEGILTIGPQGKLLSLNPAAERMFGYRSSEVLNEHVTKLLVEPPNEPQKLFHDTLAMGTILGLATGAREMTGVRKNGETFPLELVVSSLSLDDGQQPVTVAFARDVSKRKQAQRYLTAHYAATCILADANSLEEALPQILQTLSEALRWEACAYWTVEPATGSLRCTGFYQAPSAAKRREVDPAKLVCHRDQGLPGKVCSQRQPVWQDDLPRLEDSPDGTLALQLQLRTAFAFPVVIGDELCGVVELFSTRSLKRESWLLDIMGEFGKQLGHFIARKRNEKRLIRSEERFRQLAEHIHEVFWMMDARDGRMIYVSPSCEEVWGRPHRDWQQSSAVEGTVSQNAPSLVELAHPEDRTIVLSALDRQKRGEKTSDEYRIVRPDGEIRWVWSRAFPVLDDAKSVYRIVGITADITEQKRLEERLRQSQKMEAIGQLAGGVAHDFNNLLTVIIGYSEILLSQSKPGEDTHEMQQEIKKAAERAATLTRQLLAFGRKQTFQVKVLDINLVVQDMSKMLRHVIGEDIEMILQQEPHLGKVSADPSQIEQILLNLATNARDAMPEGGTLTITTSNVEAVLESAEGAEASAKPAPYVLLTVADTGIGMNQLTQAHAFEPFFTTKEVGKGTGLGLATVYGIVKQSHGHIEVDSQLGCGTTFRIYLPRLVEEETNLRDDLTASTVQRGQETVLLVEDEESVRRLVCQALESSGYTVLTACSGHEALAVCQQHPGDIDLLVTDVIMPEMNGVQLAELATTIRKDLKVLYISGYTSNILERHGALDATKAILSKPVSPRALATKVREVLDSVPCKTAC